MDINDLKKRNNILDTIGKYVALKRNGKNYSGLCPFHSEKHPSFSVHPPTGTFRCFSCGKKGDVITFIRELKNCTFAEAIEILGYPRESATAKPGQNFMRPPESTPVIIPNHQEFLNCLMGYTTGDERLTFTYHRFEVGISPHMVPQPWYSQRNRLVFPIRDHNGVLRGFSARSTDPGCKTAKYIHTASSDGFRSSENLYGLYQAKQQLRRTGKVYVVEGFKDVLTMHAAGIENCVGLMGTSLSSTQLALLKESVTTVYLVLDADKPGNEAAGKIKEILQKAFLVPVVIHLPDGHDPDSFYREQGAEALATFIREGSIRPRFVEMKLIINCLLYPYSKLGNLTFVQKTANMLRTLDLPFVLPLHNELLDLAVQTERDDNSTKRICRFLNRMQQDERASFWFYYPETGLPDIDHLNYILDVYLEGRMVERIVEITRELTFPPDGEEYQSLLQEMNWRKTTLELISGRIGRAGAVYW